MNQYLIKMSENWADEFDCQEFLIMQADSKAEIESKIEKLVEKGGYFGTNEGFEEGELDEDCFEVIQLLKSEYDVYAKHFEVRSDKRILFGTGILYQLDDC